MVGYGITLDWQRFTSLCIGLPGFTIYTCMPVVYILYIDGVIVRRGLQSANDIKLATGHLEYTLLVLIL